MSDTSFLFAEDKALKTLLQGIYVQDTKDSTRPVKVWFGYPDVELKNQEYPYIIIDLFDIQPANDRQQGGFWIDNTNRGTQAPASNGRYTYYAPVVYDLYYQVSTFARHPRHDRAIIFEMLNRKIPGKFGHLIIPQANGNGFVARHMFLEGFVKRDSVEDGRRLLRNVFSIRVVSEMTPYQAATPTPQVQTANVMTTGNPPSGFELV